jgi:hypothetical protein
MKMNGHILLSNHVIFYIFFQNDFVRIEGCVKRSRGEGEETSNTQHSRGLIVTLLPFQDLIEQQNIDFLST